MDIIRMSKGKVYFEYSREEKAGDREQARADYPQQAKILPFERKVKNECTVY